MEFDIKAKFKCWKCKHHWEDKPGPTQCPSCGHLYFTWLNYKRFIAREYR